MKNRLRALGKLQLVLSGFLVTFMLALAGCGGGGGGGGTVVGGGIGGTGAVGTVSAIGSVTVNGLTYSCFGAVVTSDDGTTTQGSGDNCVEAERTGQLSVGALVTITGTRDANGTLTAMTVSISRNVLGPVANKDLAELSFTVLNQRVIVSETTRFEIGNPKSESFGTSGLTNLSDGDTVEVSGFRNANGDILASLVEAKIAASGEFELKGYVDGSAAALTIAKVSIDLNGQPAPTNGACVEAKGSFDGSVFKLTDLLKPDDDCNGGSVSGNLVQAKVEGVINGFVSTTEFNVGNQKITTTATTTYIGGSSADLQNGVTVEAEGSTTNGTLIAKKIQIKSNGVRIEGNTDTALSGGSFQILGITVKVVASTENSIGPIVPGTHLKLEGSKTGPTEVTAAKIDAASGSDTELRGPLDAIPASPSFAILGVQVKTIRGTTQFNGTSSTAASDSFFIKTIKDQIVKALGTPGGTTTLNATEVENED